MIREKIILEIKLTGKDSNDFLISCEFYYSWIRMFCENSGPWKFLATYYSNKLRPRQLWGPHGGGVPLGFRCACAHARAKEFIFCRSQISTCSRSKKTTYTLATRFRVVYLRTYVWRKPTQNNSKNSIYVRNSKREEREGTSWQQKQMMGSTQNRRRTAI